MSANNNSTAFSRLKKAQDEPNIYHNPSKFSSNLPGNQSQSRRNDDFNRRPNVRSQRPFDSTPFHNRPRGNGRHFTSNRMQSSSQRGGSHVFPNSRGRVDPKPKYEVQMLDISKTKLSYGKLEQLSTDEDPLKVAVELANTFNGLDYLLGQDVFLKERPDWIILITKNLTKVCACDFPENKVKVLNVVFDSQFIDFIIHCLQKLSSSSDKQRIESFLKDIHTLLETLIETFPTSSMEKLHPPVQQVFAAISCMEQFEEFRLNETIKTNFTKLDSRLRELKATSEKLLDKNKKLDDGEPPEDFRTFELYPTEEEIRCKSHAFLRRNIVDGGYRDVEHYLDVQFRLLREDLMMPLREGFSELVEKLSRYERGRMKINYLRYFENCSFLSITTDHGTVSYDVCFDIDYKLNHINWEYNQWFKYGSLVFFSFDNFSTFLVGKVAEKNNKTCREDRIISVELIGTKELQANEWGKKVSMVESTIFFQPYYHVMKALMNFKESNFPLKRYIVDVKSDIRPPVYLHQNSLFEIDGFTFDVLHDSAWPSAEKLCLNEFQYEAFKAALTQEFVIMQGPPGTGKTYLGLKIVKALVGYKTNCVDTSSNIGSHGTRSSPIVVVCYTNHALDQFLEGILKFTKKVVRVGSMTKSELIKPHELSQLRFKVCDRGIDSAYMTLRNQMKDIITQINTMKQNLMNIDGRKGILKLRYLSRFMSPAHEKQLGTDEKLVQWLLMTNDFVLDDRFHEFQYKNPEGHTNDKKEIELVDSDSEDEIRREFKNEKLVLEMGMDENIQENIHALHLEQLHEHRLEIERRCTDLEYNYTGSELYARKRWCLQSEYQTVCYSIDTVQEQHAKMVHFARVQNVDTLSSNLAMLSIDERWKLYLQWVNHLKSGMMNSMKALEKKYRDQSVQFQETQQLQDLYVLRKFDIVGITTTAAAKNHNLLSALKPNIVIVEEAAEVLEAHIVTALTDHCQHLILIGDHQQLRPNPNVYKLAKQYKLEISLFERMINNKLNFSRLGIQHRMRPEICELITPSIYPNLQNHPSVYTFDDVRGLTNNLFFVTHEVDELKDDTIQSYRNPHEGDFVLELAQYLLLQGYSSDEITILTTYSGQLIYLKMEKKTMPQLSDVRLTTVDNYQGEECQIILLSLVRSNPEDKIGFLATSNRVCVALSRAKKGFYLIGNMKALETSAIWKNVKNRLEQLKAIGSELELKCTIHGNSTFVKEKNNFLLVAEGGCSIICGTPLNCGHNCAKLCHSTDLAHESYLCRETCKKSCSEGHPCTYQCYQCRESCQPCKIIMKNFELACGHVKDIECYQIKSYNCKEKVEANIERCGHNALVPCYQITSGDIICPKPCDRRLSCGHQCTLTCHYDEDPDHIEFKCKKKCERLKKGCKSDHNCNNVCSDPCPVCNEEVMKQLPCGHSQKGLCHLDAMECLQMCNKTLDCGHPCRKLCKEKCGDCNVLVEKTIPECGHKVNMKCKAEPHLKFCHNPCQKLLTCGHLCSKKCNEDCTSSNECPTLIEMTHNLSLCSHGDVKVPCKYATLSEENLKDLALKYCTEPCAEVLLCGHACKGTCGECQQTRYHKICNEQCERRHLCGHQCKQDCSAICVPCEARCSYRCRHRACKLSCREPCKIYCYDECPWKCEHQECPSECSDICRRRRCYKPCRNTLPCGHECIGYCGEPCPDKCRVCDEDEVQTQYFGSEKEKDARFVVLEDCGHFFESKGIELYIGVSSKSNTLDTEIVVKTCPKCKTPIVSTLRFMNAIRFIKRNMQAAKARQKIVLGEKSVPEQKIDLIQRIKKMEGCTLVKAGSKYFGNIQRNLLNELEDYVVRTRGFNKTQRKSKYVTVDQLRLFTFIVDCLECLESGFSQVNRKVACRKSTVLLLNRLDEILMNLMNIPNNKISQQLKYDFFCEIDRLYALINLLSLKGNYQDFAHFPNNDTLTQMHTKCMEELARLDKFDRKLSNHFDSMLNDMRLQINRNIPIGMTFDPVSMLKPDATLWNDAHGTKVRVFKCFSNHMYHVVQTGLEDAELETACPDCARRGERPQTQPNNTNIRQYQIGQYQSSSAYGQDNRSNANTGHYQRQRNQRYEPNRRHHNNKGNRRGQDRR
uniref:NFX1-type zinc finger-containing protein 1 n=1 Tax=Cacopsylla melanoneura TaxID=428564 RepID=A0A8D8TX39_9HEMI